VKSSYLSKGRNVEKNLMLASRGVIYKLKMYRPDPRKISKVYLEEKCSNMLNLPLFLMV